MEFSLLWSAALGFGLAWAALRRTRRYPNRAALVDPLWGAVGVGVFGGRIGSMIGNGTNPLTAPGDILLIRGGVSTAVASVCAIAIWLYAVRDDIPVLLIDEGCRSGKEIFALGWREMGVGPIVGARTGGSVAGGRLFVVKKGGISDSFDAKTGETVWKKKRIRNRRQNGQRVDLARYVLNPRPQVEQVGMMIMLVCRSFV